MQVDQIVQCYVIQPYAVWSLAISLKLARTRFCAAVHDVRYMLLLLLIHAIMLGLVINRTVNEFVHHNLSV